MARLNEPKLRVPCDRSGLTCREGGRKEARAQPCKPIDAHALIVGEEEARRIRRRRQREGAIACVGHLPLQLLKGVQQQAQPLERCARDGAGTASTSGGERCSEHLFHPLEGLCRPAKWGAQARVHEESSCLSPAPPAAQLHVDTDEGAQRGEGSRAAEHELAREQGREWRRTGRAAREEPKHPLQLHRAIAGEWARLDDQMAPAFARRHPAASIDFEGRVLGNTAADDKEAAEARAGAGDGARRCGRTLGSACLGARAALGKRAIGEGGVWVEGCKGRKRGAREHASGDGAALAIPSAQLRDRRTQQRAQLGGMQLDCAISLLPHAKEDRLDGLESCQPQRRAWLKHQSQGVLEEVGQPSQAHAHAQAAATAPRTQLTSQPNSKAAPHILAGLALGVVVCAGCGGGFRRGGGAGAAGVGVGMGGGGEGGGGCAQGGEAHKGRVRVRSGGREQREEQCPPLRREHGEGDMHRGARARRRRQHDGGVVR